MVSNQGEILARNDGLTLLDLVPTRGGGNIMFNRAGNNGLLSHVARYEIDVAG